MIYLLLILLITILWVFTNSKNNKTFMVISFLLVFLVFALRNPTVGRDTIAYANAYNGNTEVTAKSFFDLNYIYFEKGYVLLMHVFKYLFKAPFHIFLIFCNLISLIPVWVFINKYSSNKYLSIITFICYMFFEFYLTGLRQSLSISICLIGIMCLLSEKKGKYLFFALLILLASFFHKASIVCIFIPVAKLIKNNFIFMIGAFSALAFSILFRPQLLNIIGTVTDKQINGGSTIYFGLNMLVVSLLLISLLILTHLERIGKIKRYNESYNQTEGFFLRLLICAIVLGVFFGTDTTARAFMNYAIVIIILIPKLFSFFSGKSNFLLTFIIGLFFVTYFSYTIFVNNSFDILPYKFFWQ